jgi:hypothetical protein
MLNDMDEMQTTRRKMDWTEGWMRWQRGRGRR